MPSRGHGGIGHTVPGGGGDSSFENPFTQDLVVTGDGSSDLSPDNPSVTLGVEVGGNNNAHVEVASPASTGTAYIDLTEVGSDYKTRLQWDAAAGRFSSISAGLNSQTSASVITGTVTSSPGINTVENGMDDGAYHFYGGQATSGGGNIVCSGTPGGAYLYFQGGRQAHFAGHVSISGSHEMAVVEGGVARLEGGDALFPDTGGDDAYSTEGGFARLKGGSASNLDATSTFAGGQVTAEGATDAGAGGFKLEAPVGSTVIEGDATSKLGFYGASPVAQQTGVAVTAAAIHAALVNLGLITA